eukprot:UN18781
MCDYLAKCFSKNLLHTKGTYFESYESDIRSRIYIDLKVAIHI